MFCSFHISFIRFISGIGRLLRCFVFKNGSASLEMCCSFYYCCRFMLRIIIFDIILIRFSFCLSSTLVLPVIKQGWRSQGYENITHIFSLLYTHSLQIIRQFSVLIFFSPLLLLFNSFCLQVNLFQGKNNIFYTITMLISNYFSTLDALANR